MAQPFLSIIIPAYNEAERIPHTLIDMDKILSRSEYSYEIMVMNDGSTDNTAEIVRNMEHAIKNLKLIDNSENKGKGGVVRQGMLLARGKYRLFTDADNSTSVDHFNAMVPLFKEGCDIVICDRALKGSKLEPAEPIWRQIPGKLGNLVIQALLLPGIWDTQCGFKAFTDEAAEKIFMQSKISGWGFDVEILALAKKFGYKIKEIPVHWVNAAGSKLKLSAYLKVLLETFKIRWWLWTGAYGISQESTSNSR
ncbi:MAG: glycosyltransferase family 2 protein [Patescibacteria group bacterium]|nr:glycosyltransferase family 2 protein [Patescibacteria group bacterium]MDE2015577.1 glycosyltransferase family 2 protein [Patescibacteria group bacterium]MDE2227227.1 glycosyltransferase family 2 protein [Patescibacteria group bacterium]